MTALIINNTFKHINKKFKNNEILIYKNISLIVFVFVGYFLTAFYNSAFFKWGYEISFFAPTQDYLLECMEKPGGLLVFLGTFLTQFYYYPYLGASLFIIILLGVRFLTQKAFQIPERFFPLSYVPSILLLHAIFIVGYTLYTLKSPGYLFSN